MGPKQHLPFDRDQFDHSISLARGGSFAVLGQLLEHYRDYLLRMANEELASELNPKVAPSDVVQETFLEAARGFPKFLGQTEGELKAWLRGVLLNNIRDARRKFLHAQKRAALLEVPLPAGSLRCASLDLRSPQSSISAPLVRAEEELALRAAMERLSEEQRRVIELRTYQSLPFEQVGARLGRSADAVRKLWVRAVEKLAAELAKSHG